MTGLHPVDTTTAALVIGALNGARTRCVSPVLALHQAGLLMTEQHARNIRHDVLVNVAEAIRNTRIKNMVEAGLMPRDASPAVVAKAVADRIDWLAEQARRGEFR